METNKKITGTYNDWFMSHALCLHSCTVLCDDLFSVIDLPIAEILGAAKVWDLRLG